MAVRIVEKVLVIPGVAGIEGLGQTIAEYTPYPFTVTRTP
jgi:hypothetical protein